MNDIKFNGNKLLRIRKGKDMSQDKLAELVGVTRQTIYLWESNQNLPDVEKVGKLCEVLEIDLIELMDGMTNLTHSRECIKENNFYKKRINKKKIIKTIMIILLCIFIIYITTSTIKFFRLKDIFSKWEKIDKVDNYYFSYVKLEINNDGLPINEAQAYEVYLKDGILTKVFKKQESQEISYIIIDNFNTKERIVINEEDKSYKKMILEDGNLLLSANLPNELALNSFDTKTLLISSLNPKFIIRGKDNYTIQYNSLTTIMKKDSGLIFYEEKNDNNPKIKNYLKHFSIELDTNKEFVIDLNEYIEVK